MNKAVRSIVKWAFSIVINITTKKHPRNKPIPPREGYILYLPEREINFPVKVVEQIIPSVRRIRKQPA